MMWAGHLVVQTVLTKVGLKVEHSAEQLAGLMVDW